MPEFDESVFDAMSDEELVDYLAHDAELPLSFVRSADAVLYAATLLASRQAEALPETAAAFESFKSDYLTVPFDGCTLWDDLPRFAPATPADRKAPQPAAPRSAVSAPAKPKKVTSERRKSASPAPVEPPKPPLSPISGRKANPFERPEQFSTQPPEKPFLRSGAGLLAAALLILLIGIGYLYIHTTLRAVIGVGPSTSASASPAVGCTLTWVPDGYSATQFTDWDVTGYLYTWQNAAGDKITFCRYRGGTNVAVDRRNAETSMVSICGVKGEYTQKNGERSLVFSDSTGANVYYLDAKNVSDGDMQKMIDAIK